MILFPNAKINLGLHVLLKRSDGFHEIESCMYPIPLCDILEIIPAQKFSFVQTGISFPPSAEKTYAKKAYDLLSQNFNVPPVYIHLRKQIPSGAGLGEGHRMPHLFLKD